MISANPQTFTEGGLIDDFDGRITSARTNLFTYEGSNIEVPALALTIAHGEDFSETYVQQYSAGDVKNFVPSEDGKGFDQVGDKGFLNKNSNLAILLASIVNSGFPAEKLDAGDYSVLDGTLCHFLRQVQPERKGLANPEGEGDKKKGPRTILCVSEVKELPGGKKAGKPVSAAKTKTTTAATAAAPATSQTVAAAPVNGGGTDESEYDDKLMEIVVAQIEASGGSVKQKDLVQKVFQAIKTDPKFRGYAMKRCIVPEFLANGPWAYENNVLSIAG